MIKLNNTITGRFFKGNVPSVYEALSQLPPHTCTLDKIMAKLILMKNDLKLDTEPKGQGHSKKQRIIT